MAIVFKSKDFVNKLKWLATTVPTEYYDGSEWGRGNSSTKKWKMACNISIKMILGGFNDDRSKTRGGCIYASNGVPDWTCDGVLNYCTGVSQDFSNLIPGEILNMKGSTSHVGVYIGDGKVFECTSAGEHKAMISEIDSKGNRFYKGNKNPYKGTYHGKMTQWIDYSDQEPVKPNYEPIEPKMMVPNKDYIDKWDLSFTKWKDAKSVGILQDGEQVKIVAQYKHPLTGVYYITEEDFNKDAFVGYNCVDLKVYEEPKVEEPIDIPAPEEPTPEKPVVDEKTKEEKQKEYEEFVLEVANRDEAENALLWFIDGIANGIKAIKNFFKKIFKKKK